jgi:hypothetical protein
LSAPAFKISDELVAQQTLGAVASASTFAAIRISWKRRDGGFGKLGASAKSATMRVITFSPSSNADALCATRPCIPGPSADLPVDCVAASPRVNGNDRPTVKHRGTGAECSVDRAHCPTISDITIIRFLGDRCACGPTDRRLQGNKWFDDQNAARVLVDQKLQLVVAQL